MSDYTFGNKTGGKVKVCIYHVNDPGWVPVEGGVVFLNAHESDHKWSRAPGEKHTKFQIKYFHPELGDKLLAARNEVPIDTTVNLLEDNNGYWIEVT